MSTDVTIGHPVPRPEPMAGHPDAELVRAAFAAPRGGVLGLVDALMSVARRRPLRAEWKENGCRIRLDGDDAPDVIEVPFRKSVFRTALVRVSILCDRHNDVSLSPYGGVSELVIDGRTILVSYTNTPDAQVLELTPLIEEPSAAVEDDASARPGSRDGGPA